MLESFNYDLNTDIAILYASKQYDKEQKEVNYEDLVENNDYILVTDPIKRIADMKY